jgi:hypothetical protein
VPFDWLSVAPNPAIHDDHETPKPAAFGNYILEVGLGPRSGRVLELFAGTCPVASAAEGLGFDAIAVDLEDWAPVTAERGRD